MKAQRVGRRRNLYVPVPMPPDWSPKNDGYAALHRPFGAEGIA
jgi:hypothetical protein